MKTAKRNHLGPVYELIKVATAVVRLAYWIVKLVTVAANYLRRPIEDQELYSAISVA